MLIRDIGMSDYIVQLVTFNRKCVSMFQYGCLDFVDNIMLFLDSTLTKVMMLSDFAK